MGLDPVQELIALALVDVQQGHVTPGQKTRARG
jgi:hypothetical protein